MIKKDVPRKFQRLYERAMSGKSRKAAIRAHCLMCMGWQPHEVPLCTAPGCPLYPYRRQAASKPPSDAGVGAAISIGDGAEDL